MVESDAHIKPGLPSEVSTKEGYKSTKLGWIPEDWDYNILEQEAEKIMVGIASAATHAYRDNGIILLRNLNIKENRIDDSDLLYINEEYEKAHRNKRLRTGDIITVRTGYPGLSAVVTSKFQDAQCFTSLITRPKRNRIDSNFLTYFINSPKGRRLMLSSEAGGAQKNINAGVLSKLRIPLPPLPEQQKIAQILSIWDQAITKTERLIAKKQERKKGLMQQLLTGKKRFPAFTKATAGKKEFVKSDKMKETKLGWIPEDWEVYKLGKYISTFSGGTPKSTSKEFYSDSEGYPWITSGFLNGGVVDKTDIFLTQAGFDNSASKIVEPETLLLALYGATAGVIAVSKIKGAINQAILAIHCDKELDRDFIAYFLKHNKERLVLKFTQGGQPNLSAKNVKGYDFPLPPFFEQQQIAKVLSSADQEISSLQNQLAKLKEQKKGLMQKLLTGEVRVYPVK